MRLESIEIERYMELGHQVRYLKLEERPILEGYTPRMAQY